MVDAQLKFMDVHWIVRESYIGAAFFDESASDFIMPQLRCRAKGAMDHGTIFSSEVGCSASVVSGDPSSTEKGDTATLSTSTSAAAATTVVAGCGLGPAWLTKTKFHDQLPEELRHRKGYLQVGYLTLLPYRPV